MWKQWFCHKNMCISQGENFSERTFTKPCCTFLFQLQNFQIFFYLSEGNQRQLFSKHEYILWNFSSYYTPYFTRQIMTKWIRKNQIFFTKYYYSIKINMTISSHHVQWSSHHVQWSYYHVPLSSQHVLIRSHHVPLSSHHVPLS